MSKARRNHDGSGVPASCSRSSARPSSAMLNSLSTRARNKLSSAMASTGGSSRARRRSRKRSRRAGVSISGMTVIRRARSEAVLAPHNPAGKPSRRASIRPARSGTGAFIGATKISDGVAVDGGGDAGCSSGAMAIESDSQSIAESGSPRSCAIKGPAPSARERAAVHVEILVRIQLDRFADFLLIRREVAQIGIADKHGGQENCQHKNQL